MLKKTEGEKERASLRAYADTFFQKHGRDVFNGLGIAVGLIHWLALGQIYTDLAKPWGKKGKERLGTPDGDGWVSVDDMSNLFGIQRARVTLQTALRLCRAIREYLTKVHGDYKTRFPGLATEIYEQASANFAKSTVTINALVKAAKADKRLAEYFVSKPVDWNQRASSLFNSLVRRLRSVGLDKVTLDRRLAKKELDIADAAFLFLDAGHLDSLRFAIDEAKKRLPTIADFKEREAVANNLLNIAIAAAEIDNSLMNQMEKAIQGAEGQEETQGAPAMEQMGA